MLLDLNHFQKSGMLGVGDRKCCQDVIIKMEAQIDNRTSTSKGYHLCKPAHLLPLNPVLSIPWPWKYEHPQGSQLPLTPTLTLAPLEPLLPPSCSAKIGVDNMASTTLNPQPPQKHRRMAHETQESGIENDVSVLSSGQQGKQMKMCARGVGKTSTTRWLARFKSHKLPSCRLMSTTKYPGLTWILSSSGAGCVWSVYQDTNSWHSSLQTLKLSGSVVLMLTNVSITQWDKMKYMFHWTPQKRVL